MADQHELHPLVEGQTSEEARPRRAVVTGGAGFLGSHLCERLLDLGHEVVCVDNFVTGSPDNIEHLLGRPGFTVMRADVSHGVTVPGPVGYVLHFASPASPVDYLRLPIETLSVGSRGTFHALDLAVHKGARFLLASTSEVYGDPSIHPQPESYWGNVNPVGPRGVYDEAKRFSEALTTAYRSTYGLDASIARIFNTYGPRMRPDDGRAIPNFIAQALSGEDLTVFGDGLQTRSICFVDDEVAGLTALLMSHHPGPMNIGNPDEISMLDLARKIIELTGSDSKVAFDRLPVDDPRVRQPDVTLASRELGWTPQHSMTDGLQRTIDYFRSLRSSGPGLVTTYR
ncbi:SDR family oxidoreductase [Knoellia locipacati]|uniref:UDP-glucuronic acid decarboxylase family protein n=1 Tax=Knoellia locipacati TaxID=882824 RepID=UPI00384EB7E8